MYYNKKRLIISIMWIIMGGVVYYIGYNGDNSLYSGIGGGWIVVGIMQIYRNIRYHSNEEYRERTDIEYRDERNGYIRMKAWAWAGYTFIIGSAIISGFLFFMGKGLMGRTVSYCMCAVLALYYIFNMILRKKY